MLFSSLTQNLTIPGPRPRKPDNLSTTGIASVTQAGLVLSRSACPAHHCLQKPPNPSLGHWASLGPSMDLHARVCPLLAAAEKPSQWTSPPVRSQILGAVYTMEPVERQQAERGEAGSGAEVHTRAELAGLVEPQDRLCSWSTRESSQGKKGQHPLTHSLQLKWRSGVGSEELSREGDKSWKWVDREQCFHTGRKSHRASR